MSADLPAGTEIGGYRIEAAIGRGGMGVVYRAEDVRLGRKVALKLLAPELAEDPAFRDRFLSESQLAAAIDHENIIPIYSAGEADRTLFIAMRYVEGADLHVLLDAEGPLEPRRACAIVAQVASALDAAHACGLVHRDVKPANILLVPREDREHCYLSDFGLTKQIASTGGLTGTGQFVGTVDYIAPEQIEGRPVDGLADVYALGCVLYESLAGRPPYRRDSEIAVLWAHMQEEPPSLCAQRAELPEQVDNVIATALAKSPAGRYPTAAALAEAFETALERGRPVIPAGGTALAGAAPPRSEAPVTRRVAVANTNLPAPANPLIGRERELGEVLDLLGRDDVRLVTLTGAGGSGKSRLALEAARDLVSAFPDGVFLVRLAPVADPALVLPTIARTLGLTERGRGPIENELESHLSDRESLLLLDNFEQLVAAGPDLSHLLGAAPRTKVLATSRAALHLRGEHEYPVEPLPLPDLDHLGDVEPLLGCAAVELFVRRAGSVAPDFLLTDENAGEVAEICVRLDGLPLAIELAAARVKLLPPAAMLRRLEHRLELLTGGPRDLPAHQQTLRNAIDWSYDLLEPAEQALFARLAVFVGGRTIESVEAVCDPTALGLDALDGVASLVDKSLLRREEGPGDEPRFVMLETIHEYALERLTESGESKPLRHRHAEYFLTLAEQADEELSGSDQTLWLARLDADHGNLRAALRWTAASAIGQLELRLASALCPFWRTRDLREGRLFLEGALAHDSKEDSSLRAKALLGASELAWLQGDYDRARAFSEEGLELYRAHGDERGIARGLAGLGALVRSGGDYARSRELVEESIELWRGLGDARGLAGCLTSLGNTAREEGAYDEARRLHEEALALFRELGYSQGVARATVNLGDLALSQGDYERAAALSEQALVLTEALGERRGMAISLLNLGIAELYRERPEAAVPRLRESLRLSRELDDREMILSCFESLAAVSASLGQLERASRLLGAAEALREAIGASPGPFERKTHERTLAAVTDLAEDVRTSAWREGSGLSLESAVAYALEEEGEGRRDVGARLVDAAAAGPRERRDRAESVRRSES